MTFTESSKTVRIDQATGLEATVYTPPEDVRVVPAGVCRHCGQRIALNRTWPSGKNKWQVRHDTFGWWSFCTAVNGNPHEPE